jgi:uncharacterized membrane protein YkoI
MRHIMHHIGPVIGLLLLAACDTARDAPPIAPDGGSAPSIITAPNLPSASAPAAIRVAEGAGVSGQAASRTLSPEQRFVPLTRILSIASQAVPGEVISVELDDDEDDDVPEYEVKILTPQGRMIEVEIAARTGKILQIEDD